MRKNVNLMKKEIGKRIKNIREEMGMTKEAFAKSLGVSGQYLGIVERGGSCLSVDKLKVLCDFTNLSADYILFGKDDAIVDNTKNFLSDFTSDQIQTGCNMLKELANLIKPQ